MMTGNTTQLGIDLSNYLRDRTASHKQAVVKSFSIVFGFVVGAFLGAFLYVKLDFWSVAFFVVPIFYLAYLAAQQRFKTPE